MESKLLIPTRETLKCSIDCAIAQQKLALTVELFVTITTSQSESCKKFSTSSTQSLEDTEFQYISIEAMTDIVPCLQTLQDQIKMEELLTYTSCNLKCYTDFLTEQNKKIDSICENRSCGKEVVECTTHCEDFYCSDFCCVANNDADLFDSILQDGEDCQNTYNKNRDTDFQTQVVNFFDLKDRFACLNHLKDKHSQNEQLQDLFSCQLECTNQSFEKNKEVPDFDSSIFE